MQSLTSASVNPSTGINKPKSGSKVMPSLGLYIIGDLVLIKLLGNKLRSCASVMQFTSVVHETSHCLVGTCGKLT